MGNPPFILHYNLIHIQCKTHNKSGFIINQSSLGRDVGTSCPHVRGGVRAHLSTLATLHCGDKFGIEYCEPLRQTQCAHFTCGDLLD